MTPREVMLANQALIGKKEAIEKLLVLGPHHWQTIQATYHWHRIDRLLCLGSIALGQLTGVLPSQVSLWHRS